MGRPSYPEAVEQSLVVEAEVQALPVLGVALLSTHAVVCPRHLEAQASEGAGYRGGATPVHPHHHDPRTGGLGGHR